MSFGNQRLSNSSVYFILSSEVNQFMIVMPKATAALQGLFSLPNQSQEYHHSCLGHFVKKYSYSPNQEGLFPAIQGITCSLISEISYNVLMLMVIIWTGISMSKKWSLLVDCKLMLPGAFLTLCSFVSLGSLWRTILFKHRSPFCCYWYLWIAFTCHLRGRRKLFSGKVVEKHLLSAASVFVTRERWWVRKHGMVS